MLMSGAPVLCGDEISTGLDAASTFDMIQVILHRARMRKQTSIISLLQPSPETVSLFDEVIVLAEGQIIFAGPIKDVENYFGNIGFRSPDFMDVADFLQMVSTDDGSVLFKAEESLKHQSPPNASELAQLFRESALGNAIMNELSSPLQYVWTESEGSQSGAQVSQLAMSDAIRVRYANHFLRSTSLIFWRFIVLWLRDRRVIIAGVAKCIAMGVSVGGVFINTDDAFSIQGAFFQAGLFIMLGTTGRVVLHLLANKLISLLCQRGDARGFDYACRQGYLPQA
jgi:ABC-2 type transporter